MREHKIRVLPVVEDGFVRGLVTQSTLAEMYLDEIEIRGFRMRHVSVGQLVTAVHGELIVGDEDLELKLFRSQSHSLDARTLPPSISNHCRGACGRKL